MLKKEGFLVELRILNLDLPLSYLRKGLLRKWILENGSEAIYVYHPGILLLEKEMDGKTKTKHGSWL